MLENQDQSECVWHDLHHSSGHSNFQVRFLVRSSNGLYGFRNFAVWGLHLDDDRDNASFNLHLAKHGFDVHLLVVWDCFFDISGSYITCLSGNLLSDNKSVSHKFSECMRDFNSFYGNCKRSLLSYCLVNEVYLHNWGRKHSRVAGLRSSVRIQYCLDLNNPRQG